MHEDSLCRLGQKGECWTWNSRCWVQSSLGVTLCHWSFFFITHLTLRQWGIIKLFQCERNFVMSHSKEPACEVPSGCNIFSPLFIHNFQYLIALTVCIFALQWRTERSGFTVLRTEAVYVRRQPVRHAQRSALSQRRYVLSGSLLQVFTR